MSSIEMGVMFLGIGILCHAVLIHQLDKRIEKLEGYQNQQKNRGAKS